MTWLFLILLAFPGQPRDEVTWHPVSYQVLRPAWESGESCSAGPGSIVARRVDYLEIWTQAAGDTAWIRLQDIPVGEDGRVTAYVPAHYPFVRVQARSVVTMDGKWTTTVPPRGPWRHYGCWSTIRILSGPGLPESQVPRDKVAER